MLRLSRRNFVTASVAATLIAASCLNVLAQGTPKRGGALTATWGGFEPQALFVPPGGGSSPNFTATKVFERLLRLNVDLKFEPSLALEVTPAADFKSYTIKLRPGVKWQDGKDLTSEDIVFNALEYWKPISGGISLKALTGAQATDNLTVILTFSEPTPEFFLKSYLSGRAGLVIPKHIYAGTNIITNPANNKPIGTGPYAVKEWVRGSHVEYVRNDLYWDAGKPYVDRLIIRWWRDPASRSAAFEAGQLDIGIFNPIPPPDIPRLTDTKKFVVDTKGYSNAAWQTTIEFNQRGKILTNPQVRHALMHAIDRQFIADTVFFGRASPAKGPISGSNTIFFTKDVVDYPFDAKKAASLLDAAGYPVKGGSRFTLNLVAAGWFEENGKIGQYIKQALEDVDITVNLTVPDRATSFKRIYTDYDYDVAISNNSNGIELVPAGTQFFTTDGIIKGVAFRNATGYSNKDLDEIVAKMTVETDPAKRLELVHSFSQFVAKEAPLLPMVDLEPVTIARSDVRSHSTAADYLGDSWADIWLDR